MKKVIIIISSLLFCTLLSFGGYKYYSYSQNKPYSYDPGRDFVTDVSASNKHVKIKLIIEFENSKHKKFLEQNNHKIQDLILFTIRDKDEETLKSKDIKQILTREIIESLKNEYGIDSAKMVYFNEFVVE